MFTSCGYAVPTLDEESHKAHSIENADHEIATTGQLSTRPCKCFEDRHLLEQWLVNKVNKKALDAYMVKFNSRSLDGLLALRAARKSNGEWLWLGDTWAWVQKRLDYPEAVLFGVLLGILLCILGPALPVVLLRLSVHLGAPVVEFTRLLSLLLWRSLASLRLLVFKVCLLLRIAALNLELLLRSLEASAMPGVAAST